MQLSSLGLSRWESLPESEAPESIPNVGELDELETFVGSKKQGMGVDCG